jgi:hypothetical protein
LQSVKASGVRRNMQRRLASLTRAQSLAIERLACANSALGSAAYRELSALSSPPKVFVTIELWVLSIARAQGNYEGFAEVGWHLVTP